MYTCICMYCILTRRWPIQYTCSTYVSAMHCNYSGTRNYIKKLQNLYVFSVCTRKAWRSVSGNDSFEMRWSECEMAVISYNVFTWSVQLNQRGSLWAKHALINFDGEPMKLAQTQTLLADNFENNLMIKFITKWKSIAKITADMTSVGNVWCGYPIVVVFVPLFQAVSVYSTQVSVIDGDGTVATKWNRHPSLSSSSLASSS